VFAGWAPRVQDVARDTNRGHTVRAVNECFQLAKDCGFKVVAHMMPDLPNMGMERDMNGFMVPILPLPFPSLPLPEPSALSSAGRRVASSPPLPSPPNHHTHTHCLLHRAYLYPVGLLLLFFSGWVRCVGWGCACASGVL
jgi:hypothetical protein